MLLSTYVFFFSPFATPVWGIAACISIGIRVDTVAAGISARSLPAYQHGRARWKQNTTRPTLESSH